MKTDSNNIAFDNPISQQSKLTIISILKLRLERQISEHILYNGDELNDDEIESLKYRIKNEFYNMLKDFIDVKFHRGRFGVSTLQAEISLPYISNHEMKRISNDNEYLIKLNEVLKDNVKKYRSITRWGYFKLIFKRKIHFEHN